MVKVNRVESNILGFSDKEHLHHNPSPAPASCVMNELRAEVDTHMDSECPSGSGVTNRTPEGPCELPEASQMQPGNNESSCCSPEPHDLSMSQDCSVRVPPLEHNEFHSSSHTISRSAETETSLCPNSKGQTSPLSCTEVTLTFSPNTDSTTDTKNHDTAKAEKMDIDVHPKQTSLHSTTQALYAIKTEPVEGDSCSSRGALSPSGHNFSLEKSSKEENIFPPLLQRNAVDMPQLTPETADKVEICPLPPVLTQEMPSLTPAHDGITDVAGSVLCNDQVAPVLQRETPTGSPSSNGAKQEEGETDLMMPKEHLVVGHATNWNLDTPHDCEGAVGSDLKGSLASGGMCETLVRPEIAAENDRTKLEDATTGQSDASPCQLVQTAALQTGQQCSSAALVCKYNTEEPAQRDGVSSLNGASSLLTGTSNSTPPTPSSLSCTENGSHSAVQVHTSSSCSPSHCSYQTQYTEPKPFSSSIWRNLNFQSPAVLTQSLNPDLPSVFTHDPLPYTMWTEPRFKAVTELENAEQDLRKSENKDEEGGPLTWAQLKPTSIVSVGASEPLSLCGDYDVHRGEQDRSEALSLCRELGRQRETEENPHPETAASPLAASCSLGGEQDGVSDVEEEEGSDAEEVEHHSSAKEESSSDFSDDDDDEENQNNRYEYYESGLEPGEVCAVSIPLHIIICSQSFAQYFHKFRLFTF